MIKPEVYESLVPAFSHTGMWTWWAHKFPDAMQVEFDRAQLFVTTQRSGIAPSGKIAVRFMKPLSVTFLEFGKGLNENWPDEFHNDKAGPFEMDPDAIFFDKDGIRKLAKTAKREITVHGCDPFDPKFDKGAVMMAFKAGNAGLAVSAESFALLSTEGAVDMELIPAYYEKWQSYCEEYWERKSGKKPMPYDLACELTGPPGK